MKQFKGTPGPYFVRGEEVRIVHVNGPMRVIQTNGSHERGYQTCFVPAWNDGGENSEAAKEAEANARLFQHAPDLLEALQDSLRACDKDGDKPEWDFARDVINKIIGE